MRFLLINNVHYNLDRLLDINIVPINKNKETQAIFQTYLLKVNMDGRGEIIINHKPMRYKELQELQNTFIAYLKNDNFKIIEFREDVFKNISIYVFT